jgi:hypothetical protein
MPTIDITAGELPPPQCYANEQDRLEAYAAALIAQQTVAPEWEANAVSPPAGSPLYWLRLDANANPVEILKFSATAPSGWARVQTQFTYGVGGGAANAYTVTLSPTSPGVNQAYRTGVCYAFIANAPNTGATTVAVDGLAAKAVTKFGTVPLVANDIVANQMCVVVYDGTRFQLLNPGLNVGTANIAPGTDRQFLRTNSTPATVWESGYITPVASYLAIPAAGATASFSHGMSVLPLSWSIGIICITNDTTAPGDSQYEVGDFIPGDDLLFSTSESIFTTYANSNVIAMVRFNGAFSIYVRKKTTGDLGLINEAKWKVMARAIR